jgi:hypothetical protein
MYRVCAKTLWARSEEDVVTTTTYLSEEDALQAAEKLIDREHERRRKNPKKGPAHRIWIERPDGTKITSSRDIVRASRLLC